MSIVSASSPLYSLSNRENKERFFTNLLVTITKHLFVRMTYPASGYFLPAMFLAEIRKKAGDINPKIRKKAGDITIKNANQISDHKKKRGQYLNMQPQQLPQLDMQEQEEEISQTASSQQQVEFPQHQHAMLVSSLPPPATASKKTKNQESLPVQVRILAIDFSLPFCCYVPLTLHTTPNECTINISIANENLGYERRIIWSHHLLEP